MGSLKSHNPISLHGLLRGWLLILYTLSRTLRTVGQPVAMPLLTHRTQTYDKQRSMPPVGFEPMTLVFEPAYTVHALDPAVILIARYPSVYMKKSCKREIYHCHYVISGYHSNDLSGKV
jgi:hypothetical protein